MDREAMLDLGVTSHGTPILFNRFVCEADVRILTGRILPHYFAGFSGGRKALLPGVAGFDTIVANHRLTLHPRRGLHPQTRPAVLDGNPVHLDMLEATRALGPEFTLNTILDTEHHLIDVVAGDVEQAHLDGCARVDRMFHRRIAAPVDALVTSAGGSPYDCNFMQALKAVMNVANVVRDGGAILWLAECTHGIHPGFLEWAAIARDQDLEAAVRSQYNLRGHNTLMLRELTRRLEIALCSRLRDEDVRQMGFHPVRDLASGLAWLSDQLGDDYTWMSVPNGNVTCASLS
jgi:nickel-dependent lactate racemase